MGSLKKLVLIVLAIAFVTVATAHSAPDLLFNYHFVGTTDLLKGTNTATLKKVWELPETVILRDEVLRKLSETPEHVWGNRSKTNPDSSTWIRPLLEDLLALESLAEMRRGTNGPGEIVVAVKIPKARLQTWESNLKKAVSHFAKGNPQPTKWEKFSGWESRQNASPNLIRSIWTGEWLVLGVGQDELPLQNNLLRRLASGNQPVDWKGKTNWLEVTIDFPRLQEWLPLAQLPVKPAKTEIFLSNKDDYLRTFITATYPQALNWKADKWQIPTNVIRDPMTSFTAGQNLSVLVKSPELLVKTGANPLTNQVYIWSQAQLPFMTFGAVPVKDSQKTFSQLSDRLPPLLNPYLQEANSGKIVLSTNKESLVWTGMSMIAPQLSATNEPAGQFIFAGLFPPPPSRQDPPQELIEQVSTRTNLIYYDWEITQHRLGHWQMLSKMLPFLGSKRAPLNPGVMAEAKTNQTLRTQLSRRIAHERWQSKVAPFLGNTITEVTQSAPNQIELVRKSHIGFTGIELLYISRWLNDPAFPLFREKAVPAKNN